MQKVGNDLVKKKTERELEYWNTIKNVYESELSLACRVKNSLKKETYERIEKNCALWILEARKKIAEIEKGR